MSPTLTFADQIVLKVALRLVVRLETSYLKRMLCILALYIHIALYTQLMTIAIVVR